jgi:hypothetical protein
MCIKASKRKKAQNASTKSNKNSKPIQVPLPINSHVQHKTWSDGVLISKENSGIITVAFDARVVRFIYPDAFTKGHLAKA